MNKKIEISYKTIVFTVFFLIALKFIWLTKDLIASLFIAFIIVSVLKPAVLFLERKGWPKIVATLFIYLLFLFVILNIFIQIIPPLFFEMTHLIRNLPFILRSISPALVAYLSPPDIITQNLPDLTNHLFDIIRGVFSNAIFVISTLFFGFYLLLEKDTLKKSLKRYISEEKVNFIAGLFDRAEKRMNAWVWGELILMSVVGIMTFVGLQLIGMRYVLALSILAGLLEVVPTVGPIASLIPALIIGLSQSYFLGATTIALYFIIQQLENHLIVPLVMRRAVGLSPLVTLIALIVGGKMAGVLGILLAVPTTLFLDTILSEIVKRRNLNV